MPQNDGEVRVEITGDSSKIKKALKETESAVKDTADSVSEMTAALEDTSGTSDNFKDIAESAEEAAKAISGVSEEAKKLSEEASKPVALPDIGDSLEKRISQILSTSSKEINNLERQLSEIDKALQLNPGNVELVEQKFAALGSQISATRDKLEQLKNTEQEITQKFANGEISAAQYNAFRREILNTEAALRDLIAAQDSLINRDGDFPIEKVKTEVIADFLCSFKLRNTEQLCDKTRTISRRSAAEAVKVVVVNFKARRSFLLKRTTRHSRTIYLQAVKFCHVGHCKSVLYLFENIRLLSRPQFF